MQRNIMRYWKSISSQNKYNSDYKYLCIDEETGGVGWWLRSPGDDHECAAYVYGSGGVEDFGSLVTIPINGIRPALWLQL